MAYASVWRAPQTIVGKYARLWVAFDRPRGAATQPSNNLESHIHTKCQEGG